MYDVNYCSMSFDYNLLHSVDYYVDINIDAENDDYCGCCASTHANH